jgi:predicted nucleotidyltransferase component of viral defense system
VITREELRQAAREFQLDVNVVEKDHALGWLLAGIGAHPALRETWIFKGGTCLKKCWFETYRFSEDLDFTLRDEAHLDQAFLARTFDEIADWVYEQSGIELPRDARVFEIFTNPRGKRAGQGRVGYRGPNARVGGTPRIKLDLAADELLALEPVWRKIHHPYSDAPPDGMPVLCYAYEEVFAEKLRALAERQRPRDLYDVIHLHRRLDLGPDRARVQSTLARKCEFKGIDVPTLALLTNRPERQAIEVEWEQMLAHQLPVCPPFAEFWDELHAVFAWLQAPKPHAPLPSIGRAIAAPAGGLDTGWSAPPMVARWGYAMPLEAVRFAGANRLLVELDYEEENGERSRRTIEPYALRRTRAGELLLYAVRSEDGETRSYRVDRMRGARVLPRSFTPRYAVELIAGAPSAAPTAIPRAAGTLPPMAPVRTSAARPASRATKPRRGLRAATGQTYIYECALCRKQFERRTNDSALKPHKDPRGRDCPGRTGIYRNTKY